MHDKWRIARKDRIGRMRRAPGGFTGRGPFSYEAAEVYTVEREFMGVVGQAKKNDEAFNGAMAKACPASRQLLDGRLLAQACNCDPLLGLLGLLPWILVDFLQMLGPIRLGSPGGHWG